MNKSFLQDKEFESRKTYQLIKMLNNTEVLNDRIKHFWSYISNKTRLHPTSKEWHPSGEFESATIY